MPPPLRQRLGAFRNDEEASQVYHDLSDIHCELGEEVVVDDEGEIEVCIEDSDSSVSDSSEELEVDSQAENETEICNGIKWSREPRHNVRLHRNIINERQRTLVNDTNPLAVFEKLFPEEVRRVILRCTNRKADALRRENPESYRGRTYDSFSFLDLNAFLGFIIRAGADRDNMSALIDFYNANDSKPFFRACMSYNRVKFLLKCLRFDNFIDREERKKNDKLAAIRDVWEMFIVQQRRFYIPGRESAVDEQLVGYRGKIPGRTYMPSKPKKYGIKKFWLCEAGTGYALNGLIYSGRTGSQPEKCLAKTVVMKLCKPFYKSGRNITTDNFFTSHDLACALLEKDLTLLGTMRHHRKEVPNTVKRNRRRELHSTEFRFDNEN